MKVLLGIFTAGCLLLITLAIVLPVANDRIDEYRAEELAKQACEVGIDDEDRLSIDDNVYNNLSEEYARRAAFMDPRFDALVPYFLWRWDNEDNLVNFPDPAVIITGISICSEISGVFWEKKSNESYWENNPYESGKGFVKRGS
jgi:hypothetical protein